MNDNNGVLDRETLVVIMQILSLVREECGLAKIIRSLWSAIYWVSQRLEGIESVCWLYGCKRVLWDSRTYPRRIFPRRTLPDRLFPDQRHPRWTLSWPDTSPTDISPTRHIPDGHFPDQTHPRQTLTRPDISPTDISPTKCPTDIFLSRRIPQRTFPRPVKYLK